MVSSFLASSSIVADADDGDLIWQPSEAFPSEELEIGSN